MMRARNGATLSIAAGTPSVLENFEADDPGVIEADVNSTVRLSSFVTVRGGVLRSVVPAEGSSDVAGTVTSFGTGSNAPVLKDIRLEGLIGENTSASRVAGEIENTGELRVWELSIDGTTELTGGGTVRVGQTIRGGTSPGVLVNEDNLITGTGFVDSSLTIVNRGTIEAATQPNGLQFTSVTNSGVMRATGGASLSVSSILTNREGALGGTIHADDASFVNCANLSGGTLSTTGTGKIRTMTGSTNFVSDVENQGLLHIRGTTILGGVIENNGTILVDPDKTVTAAGPFVELGGSGTLNSSAGSSFTVTIGLSSSTFFTHGPQHTIQRRRHY